MRLPDFTHFTPDEEEAVLALVLLTGGGSLVLGAGHLRPAWTPDLKLVAAAARQPGGADSAAADPDAAAPAGVPGPVVAALPVVATGPSPQRPLLAAALAAAPEVVAAGFAPAAAGAAGPRQPPPAAPPPAVADSSQSEGRVDINHADLAGLRTLPGIGPKMAERILEDRRANGLYRRLEDLLRVKGIGPARLEKLRPRVIIRR